MILFTLKGMFYSVLLLLDNVAFILVDKAYELIYTFANMGLFLEDGFKNIRTNIYVVIGIFALFRLAILLINSIIEPDKLTEKGAGFGNMLFHIVGTFALLVAVPFAFGLAMEAQNTIMESNVISDLFNGDSGGGAESSQAEDASSAGFKIRSQVIEALIPLESRIIDSNGNLNSENGASCSGDCKKAVDNWLALKEKDDFTIKGIKDYIDTVGEYKVGNETEEIEIYDYKPIITFGVGCFVAYVLFSFSIDIALRTVELNVLYVLAPLFIVTFIDPKQAKSGTFNKWLLAVGKTYASLFIKLAVISLMFLLLKTIGSSEELRTIWEASGGFAKLLFILAILMFAKKAPEWIGGMIGMDGKSALGGLGIAKKVGGAALVGGALGGAITKASSAAKQKAKNFAGNRVRNTAARVGSAVDSINSARHGDGPGFHDFWSRQRAAAKQSRADNWGKDYEGLGKSLAGGFHAGVTTNRPEAKTIGEKLQARAEVKAAEQNERARLTPEARAARAKAVAEMDNAKKMFKADAMMTEGKGSLERKKVNGVYVNPQDSKEINEAFGRPTTMQDAYAAFGRNLAISRGLHPTPDGRIRLADGTSIDAAEYGAQNMTRAGRLQVAATVQENVQADIVAYQTARVKQQESVTAYTQSVSRLRETEAKVMAIPGMVEAKKASDKYETAGSVIKLESKTISDIQGSAEYQELSAKDPATLTDDEKVKKAEFEEKITRSRERIVKYAEDQAKTRAEHEKFKKAEKDYGVDKMREEKEMSKSDAEAWSKEVSSYEEKFKMATEAAEKTRDYSAEYDGGKDTPKPDTGFNPYKVKTDDGQVLMPKTDFVKIEEIKAAVSKKASKAREKASSAMAGPSEKK